MATSAEIRRRRAIALAVIAAVGVLLVILFAGPCGGDGGLSEEEDRVQDTFEEFVIASREGDVNRACSLLTGVALAQIEQKKPCPEVFGAFADVQLGASEIEITDVRVSGLRAVVDTSISRPGVEGVESRSFDLELVDGEWKIAGFGD